MEILFSLNNNNHIVKKKFSFIKYYIKDIMMVKANYLIT